MTYINPLTTLRASALMGAIALDESSSDENSRLLVARVLVLDEKTRQMWADPTTHPLQRLALVRGWRTIYREVRDALIDAGLVTNASMKSGTLKS